MRKKVVIIEPLYDPFSEDNLRDKDWYPQFINKQERERIRVQNKCQHFRWVKKCSECGLVFESEHTHRPDDFVPMVHVEFTQEIIIPRDIQRLTS